MKKSLFNSTHIEGLLYEHKLEKKVGAPDSKIPGVEYITGSVSVATDDECLNVVSVFFRFVTATTAKGSPNATYNVLDRIINDAPCVSKDGKDNALKLRIDSAIGLNEFYSTRDGAEVLVSAKRNEGGFAHIVTDALDEDEKKRAYFEADILITGTKDVEANPERNQEEKLIVRGYIFNFRKEILPVEFSVMNANGMKYFRNLDCSEKRPVFTKVWGRQISQTTYREIVEESAFGEASVRRVPSSKKDFVITGTAKDLYLWDDEDGITAQEMKEALQAREVALATMKQRQDEYQQKRKAAAPAPTGGIYGF